MYIRSRESYCGKNYVFAFEFESEEEKKLFFNTSYYKAKYLSKEHRDPFTRFLIKLEKRCEEKNEDGTCSGYLMADEICTYMLYLLYLIQGMQHLLK